MINLSNQMNHAKLSSPIVQWHRSLHRNDLGEVAAPSEGREVGQRLGSDVVGYVGGRLSCGSGEAAERVAIQGGEAEEEKRMSDEIGRAHV